MTTPDELYAQAIVAATEGLLHYMRRKDFDRSTKPGVESPVYLTTVCGANVFNITRPWTSSDGVYYAASRKGVHVGMCEACLASYRGITDTVNMW